MELPARYPYRMRWRTIVLCLLFFGGCVPVLAHKAMHNDRGVRFLNGLIELGRENATIFYWLLAGCSAGFVLIGIYLAHHRLSRDITLELEPDAIVMPHGAFKEKSVRLRYSEIEGLNELAIQGQVFLYVHSNGTKYTIVRGLMPDNASYEAVRDFLYARIAAR